MLTQVQKLNEVRIQQALSNEQRSLATRRDVLMDRNAVLVEPEDVMAYLTIPIEPDQNELQER